MTGLERQWLPFTPNRSFKKDPQLLVRAEGMYFWNQQGEQLLDACSGLFCCALGHGRREILDAIAEQYRTLDFSPPFRYSHPGGFDTTVEAVFRVIAIHERRHLKEIRSILAQ